MRKFFFLLSLTLNATAAFCQQSWIMPFSDQGNGRAYFLNTHNNNLQGSLAPSAAGSSYGIVADKRGYTYIAASATQIAVISPVTRTVVATYTSGTGSPAVNLNVPVGMITSPGNQYLYVSSYNNVNTNQLAVFDISVPGTLVPVKNISLGSGNNGAGWMDIDNSGTELYVGIDNGTPSKWIKVASPLAASPVITSVPIGTYNGGTTQGLGTVHSLVVDKARGLIYVATQSNNIIQTWSTAGVAQNVTYQLPAAVTVMHGLTLSPDGNSLYVTTVAPQQLYRFNTVTTGLPRASGSAVVIPAATSPTLTGTGGTGARIAPLLPDGAKAHVLGGGRIYEMNLSTLALIKEIFENNVSTSFSAIDPHGSAYLLNDFGDAPASYGNAAHSLNNTNYFSRLLCIGTKEDGDTINITNSAAANFDDNSNPLAGVTDDEDAFATAPPNVVNNTYSVTIPVLNNTGGSARLVVWVDFNRDGDFADAGETSALQTVATGVASQNITVSFSGYTKVAGPSFMRIRLSTDPNLLATGAGASNNSVLDGEIEDHPVTITLLITGNVFNDVNGGSDNTVNGTGIGAPGGQPLYAYLTDPISGTIIDSAQVAADGTYTFDGGAINTNYNVILTTTNAAIGTSNPAIVLPAGWVNTGEHLGSGTGNDGTANGSQSITTGNTDIGNVNFGIEQPPTANNITAAPQLNPGGTVSATVPASTFGGGDVSGGTVTSIRITAFPGGATTIMINGTTYTSVSFPPGGVTVPANAAGQPTQPILVDPASTGSTNVTIPYVTIDNAGVPSAPATARVPFLNPLPVHLLSFTAIVNGNNALLEWRVEDQLNFDRYEIERSFNGNGFTKTGEVSSNGLNTGSYSFTDLNAGQAGTVYYRLKLVDIGGRFTYSEVRVIRFIDGVYIDIKPTLANAGQPVYISIASRENEQYEAALFDISGKLLQQKIITSNSVTQVNTTGLSKGLYIIKITGKEKRISKEYKLVIK